MPSLSSLLPLPPGRHRNRATTTAAAAMPPPLLPPPISPPRSQQLTAYKSSRLHLHNPQPFRVADVSRMRRLSLSSPEGVYESPLEQPTTAGEHGNANVNVNTNIDATTTTTGSAAAAAIAGGDDHDHHHQTQHQSDAFVFHPSATTQQRQQFANQQQFGALDTPPPPAAGYFASDFSFRAEFGAQPDWCPDDDDDDEPLPQSLLYQQLLSQYQYQLEGEAEGGEEHEEHDAAPLVADAEFFAGLYGVRGEDGDGDGLSVPGAEFYDGLYGVDVVGHGRGEDGESLVVVQQYRPMSIDGRAAAYASRGRVGQGALRDADGEVGGYGYAYIEEGGRGQRAVHLHDNNIASTVNAGLALGNSTTRHSTTRTPDADFFKGLYGVGDGDGDGLGHDSRRSTHRRTPPAGLATPPVVEDDDVFAAAEKQEREWEQQLQHEQRQHELDQQTHAQNPIFPWTTTTTAPTYFVDDHRITSPSRSLAEQQRRQRQRQQFFEQDERERHERYRRARHAPTHSLVWRNVRQQERLSPLEWRVFNETRVEEVSGG